METKENKIDITQVKVGMFWYEDDTFSFVRIAGKKVKAIVELVEDDVIYGDLMASELFDINEQNMTWNVAKNYIENFSYPCKENEKIVWYDVVMLKKVCKYCLILKAAFQKIGKRYRDMSYWSSDVASCGYAWVVMFYADALAGYSNAYSSKKSFHYNIRPVLALKVD